MKLPEHGRDWDDVQVDLARLEAQSRLADYEKNLFDEGPHLVSSDALPWGDEVRHEIVRAYTRFIHGETWLMGAGAREMEADVVSMMGGILGADAPAGFITSGGSESNLCAMLAAKARAGRTGSIVMPRYAHYSFYKGCRMFELEPVVVEPIEGKPGHVDPDRMRDAIRPDTIALIGTAGTYPFGTIDPIADLGTIAAERDLYLHVDGCFGGFILPFLERGGYYTDLSPWDFRVPGVSSVSADLHKNGMIPPPASSLYFRDETLRQVVKEIAPPSGTLSGTRGTGPIAAAWTGMQLMGLDRYVATARHSIDLRDRILRGVEEIDGLEAVAGSKINLFALWSSTKDLSPAVDRLVGQGWMLATNAEPAPLSIVLCTMPQNDRSVEPFLADLTEAVAAAPALADAGAARAGAGPYGNVS